MTIPPTNGTHPPVPDDLIERNLLVIEFVSTPDQAASAIEQIDPLSLKPFGFTGRVLLLVDPVASKVVDFLLNNPEGELR